MVGVKKKLSKKILKKKLLKRTHMHLVNKKQKEK